MKKLLRSIAYLPKNRVAATLTVALVGMIATYLNWGLGMIAGALVAKEIAVSLRAEASRWTMRS